MNDLLALAVEAHGGLARWDEFKTLKTELSVDGAIWRIKQQPGLLADKIFEIDTHAERLTITPFTAPDRRSVFVLDRLVLETLDGSLRVATIPRPRLPAKRSKRHGTNSTSPTSPARPCGPTSLRPSPTPTRASRVKRSSHGMRMARNGAG
jgi:hypothetical protein